MNEHKQKESVKIISELYQSLESDKISSPLKREQQPIPIGVGYIYHVGR
jgi:hypothetical protein